MHSLGSVASVLEFYHVRRVSASLSALTALSCHAGRTLSTSLFAFHKLILAFMDPLNIRIALIVGLWTVTIAGWWLYLRIKSRH